MYFPFGRFIIFPKSLTIVCKEYQDFVFLLVYNTYGGMNMEQNYSEQNSDRTDWVGLIQKTVDYLEAHLADEIDYEEAAKIVCSSVFHFRRVFGIVCGITPADYVRRRRLSLAGKDLSCKKEKVIDVALRYGYDSPESFARAFYRFHGITPSRAKQGNELNYFPRLTLKDGDRRETKPAWRIEEKPALILTGYKKRFTGVPFGEERAKQEEIFFKTTRAKQWLLLGASSNYADDYCVVCNIDDDGYDFYIAYELDEWTRNDLFDPQVTGVGFMRSLGFESIEIPKQTYLVCETPKSKRPVSHYVALRQNLTPQLLPPCNFMLVEAPELVIVHWRLAEKAQKSIEICLPVQKLPL